MRRMVFKRKRGQSVRVGESTVTVQECSRSEVKLVIEAPDTVLVWRTELGDYDGSKRKKKEEG